MLVRRCCWMDMLLFGRPGLNLSIPVKGAQEVVADAGARCKWMLQGGDDGMAVEEAHQSGKNGRPSVPDSAGNGASRGSTECNAEESVLAQNSRKPEKQDLSEGYEVSRSPRCAKRRRDGCEKRLEFQVDGHWSGVSLFGCGATTSAGGLRVADQGRAGQFVSLTIVSRKGPDVCQGRVAGGS